jgi:hypothetical protein
MFIIEKVIFNDYFSIRNFPIESYKNHLNILKRKIVNSVYYVVA